MIKVIRNEGSGGAARAALLFLATFGALATAAALAYDRHWDGSWQLVPWGILAAIGLATVALAASIARTTVWIARAVAIIAVAATLFGGWQHFDENYKTAPLDARYSGQWESMSAAARWWEVMNGGAGHVPILAAGALAPVGIALGASTLGLPSRRE